MKQYDFDHQRQEMVQFQIRNRGINDPRILEALLKVPRHEFVPAEYHELSYHDGPLPIGEGQTISQPYIVALMTQVLHLNPFKKVLEIGTGSGYQSAVLAELCKEVYSLDIRPNHIKQAQKLLTKLNYNNVFIHQGDGYLGWPEHAPYDAIIVTCAPENIPSTLIEQLAEDGRMCIPVGSRGVQELLLVKKRNGQLQKEVLIPVSFVPMIR